MVVAGGVRVMVWVIVVKRVLVKTLVTQPRPHQHRDLYDECRGDKPPSTIVRDNVVNVPVTWGPVSVDVNVTVSVAVMVGAVGVTVTAGVNVSLAVAVLLTVRAMVLVGTGFLEDPPSSVVYRTRDLVF